VIAQVSRVQRNGHFGRKGKLEIRLRPAETPNGPVRLSATAYDERKRNPCVARHHRAGLAAGLPDARNQRALHPGAPVNAYLAEPLHFTWGAPHETARAQAVSAQPEYPRRTDQS